MANPFHELLDRTEERVVFLDGGMGTSVEDRGIPTNTVLWGSYALVTEEGRRINAAIHDDFVAAGAEILIANTHNAIRSACDAFVESWNPASLDLPSSVVEAEMWGTALHEFLIREAFDDARRAVPPDMTVAVAGCISNPEGAYATRTRMSVAETRSYYETELGVQLSCAPDLVIFETLSTESDVEGAAAAVAASGFEDIAVGMTCREDGRTFFGLTMDEVVRRLEAVSPKVWFVQCTRYDIAARALAALGAAAPEGAVLGVYANDGRLWKDRCWHGDRITPTDYAEAARAWHELGARFLGGCCGTTPEHIAELRRVFAS